MEDTVHGLELCSEMSGQIIVHIHTYVQDEDNRVDVSDMAG